MRSCRTLYIALLGSALAVTALSPAVSATASRDDVKRMLAITGKHTASRHMRGKAALADPTYTVLHDFAGGATDGSDPTAEVTLDSEGNIYGTTEFGGANGDGVIFKVAPDGTETVLHTFTGADGSLPDGKLTLLPNGDLYGTTSAGGATGNGNLFKLTASGKFKVLHDFDGTNDGTFIRGPLARDKDGNFYGTALFGGANGDGTVFKNAKDGTFTVLHAFADADGLYPEHGVAIDKAGNLYGVTAFGGSSGQGTVYKISSNGNFQTLHHFTGQGDGGFLYGNAAVDKDGNVYGSTVGGGLHNQGTVFKIAPDKTLTTLYNFTGTTDGGSPEGNMLLVGGNLYSAASTGGDPSCQCGTVYRITPKGKEKVLHAFTGGDGGGYSAGVTESDGLFYGTASGGGASGNGVAFSVTKK